MFFKTFNFETEESLSGSIYWLFPCHSFIKNYLLIICIWILKPDATLLKNVLYILKMQTFVTNFLKFHHFVLLHSIQRSYILFKLSSADKLFKINLNANCGTPKCRSGQFGNADLGVLRKSGYAVNALNTVFRPVIAVNSFK